MTQQVHTKGPWKINEGKLIADNGQTVCRILPPEALFSIVKKADASLIAAAPDMLEALQYLIQDKPGTESFEKWWELRAQAARDAIRKATGEA